MGVRRLRGGERGRSPALQMMHATIKQIARSNGKAGLKCWGMARVKDLLSQKTLGIRTSRVHT